MSKWHLSMVRKENLGFAFMGVGMLALVAGIGLLPLQQPFVPEAKAVTVAKVTPTFSLSTKEHVLVAAYRNGWTGAQWECLVKLVDIENPGWDSKRKNKHSTATGIFQVLRSPSGIWFRDYSVADQARLGAKYIAHRYKNPCRALTFHLLHGYF